MYPIYSPMQKNKLQTLKMYLFNLYIYVDSILNFQKYLENTFETSHYKFWTEQILVADNNDTFRLYFSWNRGLTIVLYIS